MVKDEQVQEKMFASIRSWQQSNTTQKEWCQQQDIPYHIFHYWYRKFKVPQGSPQHNESFVRLAIDSDETAGCEIVAQEL